MRIGIACFTAAFLLFAFVQRSSAAGVTIITHGLNSDIDGWVIAMAEQMTAHPDFPGPDATCYEIYFVAEGDGYIPAWRRLGGGLPTETSTGEIFVKLDWRQLANNDSVSTFEVAAAVAPRLLDPDFISEMNGRALAEPPLHLVGHSRGGSLISEISLLLGRQGVWVDQLTTLDPHPLNNDGFDDSFFFTVVDAPVRTYENVLFHDNYYQTLDIFAFGRAVDGAYVRRLTSLDGGYDGLGGAHSDVHLWYHGTVDLRDPADDSSALLTGMNRDTWYTAEEGFGMNAGFAFSRLGGADRTSAVQPAGDGTSSIRDGFNQRWDLGAGVADNREPLDANNGNWPNVIVARRTHDGPVSSGESFELDVRWQWAKPEGEPGEITVHLDEDLNPFNGNERLLDGFAIESTGVGSVAVETFSVSIGADVVEAGEYPVFVRIDNGTVRRFLYASGTLDVQPGLNAPVLSMVQIDGTIEVSVVGDPGRSVILDVSTSLENWAAVRTNSAGGEWTYLDESGEPRRFYRARLEADGGE